MPTPTAGTANSTSPGRTWWRAFLSGIIAGVGIVSLVNRSLRGQPKPVATGEVMPSAAVTDEPAATAVIADQAFQAHRYATRRDQYPYWLDQLLAALRVPPPFGIALLVVAVYLVGLLLALPAGFAGIYIRSLPVYVGCAGIALTLGAVYWGVGEIHHVYERLRPIFAVTDEEYRAVLDHWLNRLRRASRHLVWAAVSVAGALVLIYLAFFREDLQLRLNVTALHPQTFPTDWFTPADRTAAVAIVGFYGVCCAIALGTTARLFCVNLLFLLDLRRLPVIPLPGVVRARLRPVTDFHVRMAVAWMVGVALFGVLFFRSFDVLANAIVIVLFLLGAFTFAVPQLVFRRYLLVAYAELCTLALSGFYQRLGVHLEERWPQPLTQQLRSSVRGLESLPTIAEATGRPRMWVYDPEDVVGWLAVQVIALGTVLAQGFLGRFTGA